MSWILGAALGIMLGAALMSTLGVALMKGSPRDETVQKGFVLLTVALAVIGGFIGNYFA